MEIVFNKYFITGRVDAATQLNRDRILSPYRIKRVRSNASMLSKAIHLDRDAQSWRHLKRNTRIQQFKAQYSKLVQMILFKLHLIIILLQIQKFIILIFSYISKHNGGH